MRCGQGARWDGLGLDNKISETFSNLYDSQMAVIFSTCHPQLTPTLELSPLHCFTGMQQLLNQEQISPALHVHFPPRHMGHHAS